MIKAIYFCFSIVICPIIVAPFSELSAQCTSFKYCPQCGSALESSWRVCPQCGYKLCEPVQPQETQSGTSQQPNQYRNAEPVPIDTGAQLIKTKPAIDDDFANAPPNRSKKGDEKPSVSGLRASFGYGISHGGLGAKINFFPFAVGLGGFHDVFLYEFGLQCPVFTFGGGALDDAIVEAYDNIYIFGNFGTVGVKTETNLAKGETQTHAVKGGSALLGSTIYLGGYQAFFIDAAVGWLWGSADFFKDTPYSFTQKVSGFTFDIGIGINLAAAVSKQ